MVVFNAKYYKKKECKHVCDYKEFKKGKHKENTRRMIMYLVLPRKIDCLVIWFKQSHTVPLFQLQ